MEVQSSVETVDEVTKDEPFNIIHLEYGANSPETGYEIGSQVIPRFKGQFDFLFVSNQQAANGIIRALKENGIEPGKDVMIVSGRVSRKMAPVLRRIYDQMPEPKWVISMGACASIGGVFDNYAIVQGVDQVVPVDVFVPGCPPRPESLIYGIVQLQNKIARSRA